MRCWLFAALVCVCSRRGHNLLNENLYSRKNASHPLAKQVRERLHIIYSTNTDCPENCASCTDSLTCTVCEHGFTLTSRGRCVDLCVEGSDATNCAPGHCTAFDDTLCSKCAQDDDVPAAGVCNVGVTTCTKNNEGVCIACAEKHILYKGGCYPSTGPLATAVCARDKQIALEGRVYCSQCTNPREAPIDGHCTEDYASYCSAKTGACTQCTAPDYFLLSGGCYSSLVLPGSAVCAEVDAGECTECGSHYPESSDVCTYCRVDNCLVCDDGICTQCQKGYVLRGSGRCVRLCTEGNGLGSCAAGHCTAFGGILCSKCAYDEDVPVAGICSSAMTTCQKDSTQMCTSCDSGHLLYSGGCYALTSTLGVQVCAPENQIAIGDKTYCKKCGQTGEAPINGECISSASAHCTVSNGACESCSTTGYFLFQGGCYTLASIPGNIVCAEVSGTTCTRCRDGYGTQDGECVPCMVENCLDCWTDIGSCDACYPKYFFTGETCEDCEGGHCTACRDNMCVDCTGKADCAACGIENCVLCDSSQYECQVCLDAYEVDDSGLCAPRPASDCPESCLCENTDTPALCTGCKPGHIAVEMGAHTTCVSCQKDVAHCSSCTYSSASDSLICTACKDGYRLRGNNCERCGSGCKACPQKADKCEECFEETPYLNPSLTGCVEQCPANAITTAERKCVCAHGYYSTLQGCELCDSSCDTCSGGEVDKCVTCRRGFFLASGSWKGRCLPCDAKTFQGGVVIGVDNCSKCRGTQQANNLLVKCEECDVGYTLSDGLCVPEDAGHEDCPANCMCTANSPECTSCRSGYYTLTLPSAETCVRCSSTIVGCRMCTVENAAVPQRGKQVVCTACEDGTGLSEGKCHSCHPTCKMCNGGPNLCGECTNPAYKLSLRGDQCVPSCPEFSEEQNGRCVCLLGYRVSENGLKCVKDVSGCPSVCTCEVGNVCTGCVEGYFTYDPTAIDFSRCEACSGDFCSACEDVGATRTAHSRRPVGRYRTRRSAAEEHICTDCSDKQGCSACFIEGCNRCSSRNREECQECKPDYQLSLDKRSCVPLVPICPLGCTCSPGTIICNGCADGYFEVDASSSTSERCMRCSIPTRYAPKRVVKARRLLRLAAKLGKKLPAEVRQSVADAAWDGVAGCARCVAPSQPGPAICTECTVGKYLFVSEEITQCLDACPSGMGAINGVCFNCSDKNCIRCDNNLDSCMECRTGALPSTTSSSDNVVCEEVCPLGCICGDTADLTACTGCQQGYYEKSILSQLVLRIRGVERRCEACLKNCAACSDGTTCTTCADGYILHQDGTSCIRKCDDGHYNNAGRCTPCEIDSCLACTGAATCTLCAGGHVLSGGKCVPCHNSCQSCGGMTAGDCLACKPGTVHSTGTGIGECLAECSIQAAGNCVSCSAVIDGTKYCSKCGAGEVPIDGKCVPATAARAVACVSSGDGTCTSCLTGQFLFSGGCYATSRYPGSAICSSSSNGLCTTCTDAFTNVNGVCSNCMLGCSSCSSSASSACTACSEGYFAAFSGTQGACKQCNDTTVTNGYQGISNCRICTVPQQPGPAICLDSGLIEETINKSSLSSGAIAGISIAVVAVVGCVVAVVLWFLCCRRSKAA